MDIYQKINNNEYGEKDLDKFIVDLFEYHKVMNNPKRDLCFSKAWSMGHAYGYNEVALIFDDIVELIK